MSKVRIELNLAGINALMKSAEIEAALQDAGEAVASAAGADFETRTHKANWVSITNVYPASKDAARANYKDNVLVKAVGIVGLPTKKPRL